MILIWYLFLSFLFFSWKWDGYLHLDLLTNLLYFWQSALNNVEKKNNNNNNGNVRYDVTMTTLYEIISTNTRMACKKNRSEEEKNEAWKLPIEKLDETRFIWVQVTLNLLTFFVVFLSDMKSIGHWEKLYENLFNLI